MVPAVFTGSKRALFLAIGGLVLCVSCSYFVLKADTIIFNHKLHLHEGGECLTCHVDVDKSVELASHMPPMATCATCHDEELMSKCATCHTNPDKPKAVSCVNTDLTFSHKAHGASAKCQSCHASVIASTGHEEQTAPGHEECSSCHADRIDGHQCFDCHKDLGSMKLRDITKFTHKGNFVKNHQEEARIRPQDCFRCHDQTACGDCHNQLEELKPSLKFPESIERHFVHRGDYVTRHVIDARADQTSCKACHGTTFCSDCHARYGLTHGSPSPASPHPAGWDTGHGRSARRDIVQCAGCHEQGARTNCIICHRFGGTASAQGATVHPPGWNVSVMSKSDRMCRLCHR